MHYDCAITMQKVCLAPKSYGFVDEAWYNCFKSSVWSSVWSSNQLLRVEGKEAMHVPACYGN